jgi:hypothetical protein
MRLPEIDVGYKRGLFVLAFVYSRDKGNVLIKGDRDAVIAKLGTFTPCVVNLQRFSKGRKIGAWWQFLTDPQWSSFTGPYMYVRIQDPHRPRHVYPDHLPRESKFKIYIYCSSGLEELVSLKLRRIPKKWIPEYDKLLIKR